MPSIHIYCLVPTNASICDRWIYQMVDSTTHEWYLRSQVAPMSEVRSNTHLPWNKAGLSSNKDITLWDIEHLSLPNAHPYMDYDWYSLSLTVPMDDIRGNPGHKWNAYALSLRRDIRVSDLQNYEMDRLTGRWCYDELTDRMPIQEINRSPHLPWDKRVLNDRIGSK